MRFNHVANFCDQRRHVFAALFEVAALGIEHRAQFFHQEGHIAALAEHGGNDTGQRDDPLEMFHRLGVNENLEGTPGFIRGAGIQHDVVDRDIQRVIRQRRFHLVGGTRQYIGPLQVFMHLLHGDHGIDLDLRLDDAEAHDLFINFEGHGGPPGSTGLTLPIIPFFQGVK